MQEVGENALRAADLAQGALGHASAFGNAELADLSHSLPRRRRPTAGSPGHSCGSAMSMCGQGIPHDMEVYPGAKHAFFNDQWRAAAFRSGARSRSTTC